MFDAPLRPRPFLVLLCAVLSSAFAAAQDGGAVRTTIFRGAEIAYEVIDGLAVWQGDIILGTAEEVAAWSSEPTPAGTELSGSVRNAVPSGYRPDGSFCIWRNAVIPYVIDADMSAHNREAVLGALRIWDDKTVLRFVERGPQHTDYMRFTVNPVGGMWVCREGGLGEQVVHVEPYDGVGNLLHVIGHAIGLEHENLRRDRNRYLTVSSDNIAATPLAQLAWHSKIGYGPDIGLYDYRSIMHYRFVEPLKQRNHARPAMAETIPPGMPFGAADEVSPGDADSVARLYGRVPAEHVISTNPSGLEVIVDGVRTTAPASFRWELGSEHTLEVPSPQLGDGARYLFGRWSDDGARAHTITATRDTTLYQASFVAQHQVSTKFSVWCWTADCSSEDADGGSFTLSPPSSDGYYTLRTPIEVTAVPPPNSALKFLWWHDPNLYREPVHTGDQAAAKLMGEILVGQSNPARTFVLPGVTHEAILTAGAPIFRVESNLDPVSVLVGDFQGFTPINFLASDDRRFSGPTTVRAELTERVGKAYRHRFRSWSDGGGQTHATEVPQDRDSTLTLTLDTDYRLTTRAWGDRYGNRIETVPPSEDGFYPEGTEVRLRAVAEPPAKFLGWNGDVAGRGGTATVVMDDGKLAEAVFAVDATELRSGVPMEVALRSEGDNLDFERFYVQVPADADAVEIRFDTRTATPGTEAGLFVSHVSDLRPERVHQGELGYTSSFKVHHDNADRILRGGAVTLTIPSPPTIPRLANRWPAAYFILIRGAESDDAGARTLDGTLLATVSRGAVGNRTPQAVGTLEDRTLTLSAGAFVVDVVRAFSDPDGDVLTYRAVSSSPAVATALVSGDMVTLTPVRPGSSTITVTATDPGGLSAVQRFAVTVAARATFTDHPVVPGTTPIRAIHFMELRDRIDVLRRRGGLPAFRWTDRVLVVGVTPVRRVHLTDLRSALDAVYDAAGRPRFAYADAPVEAGTTPIKAVHIMELRAAVLRVE